LRGIAALEEGGVSLTLFGGGEVGGEGAEQADLYGVAGTTAVAIGYFQTDGVTGVGLGIDVPGVDLGGVVSVVEVPLPALNGTAVGTRLRLVGKINLSNGIAGLTVCKTGLRSAIDLYPLGEGVTASEVVGYNQRYLIVVSCGIQVAGVLLGGAAAVAKVPAPCGQITVGAVTAIGEIGAVVETGVGKGEAGYGGIVDINGVDGAVLTAVDAGNGEGYYIGAGLTVGVAGVLLYGTASVAKVPIPGVDVGANTGEVGGLAQTETVVGNNNAYAG